MARRLCRLRPPVSSAYLGTPSSPSGPRPTNPPGTWIINETAAATITALGVGTDGRPTFQEWNPPPRGQDAAGQLLGNRLLVFPAGATGVPVNEAAFGDLSGYSVYIRENLRAESSRQSDFDTDQVALRVSRREDGILTQSGRMLRFPAS
jgi:HK97 family phage major capsid protein